MANDTNRDGDAPGMERSWVVGIPPRDLIYVVARARKILAGTASPAPEAIDIERIEQFARDLWGHLEALCEDWKHEHGQEPEREYLFSGRPSFDEAPPYDCAGPDMRHYPHLIMRLARQPYPALVELLENIPLELIFAVLVLREAAAGNSDAAQYADHVAGTAKVDRLRRRQVEDVIDRLPRELQRRRGMRPKRAKTPMRDAVERVLAELGEWSYTAFLAEYGWVPARDDNGHIVSWTDQDEVGDVAFRLTGSRTDPVEVSEIIDIAEVGPGRWEVHYRLRTGAPAKIAMRTLQNIVSKARGISRVTGYS